MSDPTHGDRRPRHRTATHRALSRADTVGVATSIPGAFPASPLGHNALGLRFASPGRAEAQGDIPMFATLREYSTPLPRAPTSDHHVASPLDMTTNPREDPSTEWPATSPWVGDMPCEAAPEAVLHPYPQESVPPPQANVEPTPATAVQYQCGCGRDPRFERDDRKWRYCPFCGRALLGGPWRVNCDQDHAQAPAVIPAVTVLDNNDPSGRARRGVRDWRPPREANHAGSMTPRSASRFHGLEEVDGLPFTPVIPPRPPFPRSPLRDSDTLAAAISSPGQTTRGHHGFVFPYDQHVRIEIFPRGQRPSTGF